MVLMFNFLLPLVFGRFEICNLSFMKSYTYYALLVILIIIISCKNENKLSTNYHKGNIIVKIDTLYNILAKSKKIDSLEYENWKPFLYLKTGNYLSEKDKNAILVFSSSDTTYQIELYTLEKEKWIKNDALTNIEANPMQFYVIIQDYNFDGQKDIFLQMSASNGWSLSRGHLLTIDKDKKLNFHIETKELANMTPDYKNNIIYTDELDYSKNGRFIKKRINKWINGKLVSLEVDESKRLQY